MPTRRRKPAPRKPTVVDSLQQDFKLFLQALWTQLDLPSPTRAQYAIADYLQHGPKRLQIQAFRGIGKSWITGAFVLWTLFNNPEKKIMIISASKERADNMSIFLQKLIIETPWLSHLRPKSDDARWSRISFDVNCSPHQAPSVKSVGITGQLTGSRADLMILDDIEVPGNSMTELMREKLLQLCTEAESILTPKDDSRIMYLGTPQTTFTVYRILYTVKVVWGVPRYIMRESSLGVRMDSASVQSCRSFSRMSSVIELPGTSMSSRIIKSARLPVSCPVMPTDFTDGAWWGEQFTSKLILDHLASSDFGRK